MNSKFSGIRQETDRDRVRRENISKYHLDLSKLTFAALVLGSITMIFTK